MEENPSDQKVFLGDSEPSRQANATKYSPIEHFNLFLDENAICHLCTERDRCADQNGVAEFQDITLEK